MYTIPDFIVVRKTHPTCHKEETVNKGEDKEEKDDFFSSEGFKKYVDKYGYHFTDALAEYAISKMYNPKWTLSQIQQYLKVHNMDIDSTKHKVTLADMYYAANMYYSDFYPKAITSEDNCITAAMLIANDVDGYEGQIFSRWLSDAMQKGLEIDWELYY